MSKLNAIDRRGFVKLVGSTLVATSAMTSVPFCAAFAQSVSSGVDPIEAWRELSQLTTKAIRLGISVPRMSAHIDMAEDRDYAQIMPATVELIDGLETSKPTVRPGPGEIDELLERADSLLRRIHQAERNLPEDRPPGMSITAMPLRPNFETVKAEYGTLFETASVRGQHRSTANWYVSKIMEERYQKRWYRVAQEVCCPWYFVAIIHAMEASFNFRSHLHNGDTLKNKTTHVPRGRPKQWNPPNDWEISATDALQFDGFQDVSDWSLERTLYRWEAYNGWRSRRNGINTPYLWSFSNHYAKGKFVADNVWDPNAVSKQCGAAVMLKLLVEHKQVSIPA